MHGNSLENRKVVIYSKRMNYRVSAGKLSRCTVIAVKNESRLRERHIATPVDLSFRIWKVLTSSDGLIMWFLPLFY